MLLTDLTDEECWLLYEGADPETREGWNVFRVARFEALIEKMDKMNFDPDKCFDYVENRLLDLSAKAQFEAIQGYGAAND